MALKSTEQPLEIGFNLTEAVAGTFLELEIDLPVQPGSGLVFDLDQVEYQFTDMDATGAGATSQEAQLTFTTQTAILPWNNDEVIVGMSHRGHASAADTIADLIKQNMHVETKDRANYIVRPSIFLGLDTVNTSTVTRIEGRLIGSLVKVKQEDLTQLILSQIQ